MLITATVITVISTVTSSVTFSVITLISSLKFASNPRRCLGKGTWAGEDTQPTEESGWRGLGAD